MKTPEDETFDDLAKRQGAWGGGFQAKRAAAADKLYHSTEARWCENFVEVKHPHIENEIVRFYFTQPVQPAQESWREFASDYERGFIDGMQKQAQSSVDKAVNQMAQPAQEPVAWISPKGHIHFDPYLDSVPLYTTPPKRPWVGLTDEEILKMAYPIRWQEIDDFEADKTVNFAQMVEAKLKEKNFD